MPQVLYVGVCSQGQKCPPSKRKHFLFGQSRDAQRDWGMDDCFWGEVNTDGREREHNQLSKLGTISVLYKPCVRFPGLMTHASIVVLIGSVHFTEERV